MAATSVFSQAAVQEAAAARTGLDDKTALSMLLCATQGDKSYVFALICGSQLCEAGMSGLCSNFMRGKQHLTRLVLIVCDPLDVSKFSFAAAGRSHRACPDPHRNQDVNYVNVLDSSTKHLG